MPRPEPLYQGIDRVTSRIPALTGCQARLLATWSFGMVLAHACGLDRVALALAALLGQRDGTVRQRLRELYRPAGAKRGRRRTEFDATACFGPLLAWVTAGWPTPRLALALDATALGDRLTVLAVSVVYRGCGVPGAWAVLPGNEPGAWMPHWERLLAGLRGRLDPSWTVLVLSDRGLESPALFRAIVGMGWHPLMRVKAAGGFRPAGWRRWRPMAAFAGRVGVRRRLRGSAYRKAASRLECTLLVRWEAGHEGPWLVLTDLPPEAADAAWYGWRSWIEQSFQVMKRGGWQWQRTRMTEPARAERLWAALAVATLWLLEVGGAAEAATAPETVPTWPATRPRRHSVFRRGLALLLAGLLRGALPVGRFDPEPWPEPEPPEAPPLTEASMELDTSP
jgi:hypothetical protein